MNMFLLRIIFICLTVYVLFWHATSSFADSGLQMVCAGEEMQQVRLVSVDESSVTVLDPAQPDVVAPDAYEQTLHKQHLVMYHNSAWAVVYDHEEDGGWLIQLVFGEVYACRSLQAGTRVPA